MKFFKGIVFSVLLLIPVAALGYYANLFGNQCKADQLADFPCRILVPAAYVSGGIAVLIAIFLGFCLGYHLFGLRNVFWTYVFFLIAAPGFYGIYLVLPEYIQQEYFEMKNEKFCETFPGVESDKCLLSIYRARASTIMPQLAWCDSIGDAALKERCITDMKAAKGDDSGCTQITDKLPVQIYPTSTSATIIAMRERENCYRTATFAEHNMAVNENVADFRVGYSVDICSDEVRPITHDYCMFRLGRCDLVTNKVIASDCSLYKTLYLK